MRFSSRDLSGQYISSSYQDVLQRYIDTASFHYILDGYGTVVFGIPTASIGYDVVTSNITSSMSVVSSSYSLISETSKQSDFSLQSGNTLYTSSYAITSSHLATKLLATYAVYVSSSTIDAIYDVIYASASVENLVLTLPSIEEVNGRIFRIKKIDSTNFTIIISSSVNIDYNNELILTDRGEAVTLHGDASQYWIH